jgi:hypothetical protein
MIRALRRHSPLRQLGAGTLLLFSLDCGRARGPKVDMDSESHFLGGCATSCDSGLSCLCGVCTEPCVDASDCSGAAFGAVCRELDPEQCGSAEPAVCDVACALDADCAGVPGASCSGGWCRGPDTSGAIGGEPSEDSEPEPSRDVNPEARASRVTDEAPIATQVPPDETPYLEPPCYVNSVVPIDNQLALDALEGCENISGDLEISFAADLRVLHALRNVFGSLTFHPSSSTQRSLEGLENLELVKGDLRLSSLEVTSLASLAGLRAVGAGPGRGLVLENTFGLQNLSGLEQLENLHNLSISGAPELVSIDELQLALQMESLGLSSVPRLASIESLSRHVARLDLLALSSTGLSSLGTALPDNIDQLTITDNGLLTDTNALLGLRSLRWLQIQGNPRLTNIAFPVQVSRLDALIVADNPQLGTLSLFTLERLDDLEILRNSSLTSIELPSLTVPVLNLIVVSNGSLPAESFRSLMPGTAKLKIGGNQGDTSGLSPCPWKKDGYCDSPPTDTLCAPNTDLEDCGYVP